MSNDQELRDKLASEGIISEMSGELVPRWHVADFKAGWDAARANDGINNSLRRALDSALGHKRMLEQERDQLRAEVEKLKHQLYNRIPIKIEPPEYNELKVQCEKLAEALEFYATKATQYRDEWFVEQLFDDDLGQIARQALAEYRKSKGE